MLKTSIALVTVLTMLSPALAFELSRDNTVTLTFGNDHGISDVVTGDKPMVHSDIKMIDVDDVAEARTAPKLGKGLFIDLSVVLACEVAGTPSEFPDDLRIRNAGLDAIPAGTQLKWQVPAPRAAGAVHLAKALQPGETLKVNGVLHGGAEAGTACKVKAIGLDP